jgi:superfamily II DNA or RNA helicase
MSNLFETSFEYKLIYIFRINDEKHKGLLKIGDATIKTDESIDRLPPDCKLLNQAAKDRIKQYTNTAGVTTELLHTELAIHTIKDKVTGQPTLKAFRDHHVHSVLVNSGIPKHTLKGSTSKEWFEIDLETALKAIDAVKKNIKNLSNAKSDGFTPIIFRPEQERAIKKTLDQFKNSNKMLWNAKMRFGKTLSALEVAKQCKFEKTIIITHRPVVDSGWYEDFGKIFHGEKDCIYGSKHSGYTVEQLVESGKKFVYFASIQDLRGSDTVGGKFNKNDAAFSLNWDFVIVDEAHEGTTTALGDAVIENIVKDGNGYETKFLALSGTPFNILDKYEDNVYTWDYIMEQQAKKEWDKLYFGDSNPYDELPELKIFTYDLGKLIASDKYVEIEDKAFNFREFFRVWTGDMSIDRKSIPADKAVGDFYHEDDIKSFLNLITRADKDSHYPYATEEYRSLFKHALWMVPGVKEAKALSKLLKQHPVFGSGVFDIVNVAGDGDEEEKTEDALKKVQKAISDAGDDGYTITLSCGKLTTGVTVPEWNAVFMLSGSFSTSAANYLQTIFRVQSPCNKNGKIKQCCYVFDFAPDRTLKMVAESVTISTKAGKADESDRRILGEFLNYCPVISLDGTEMKKYDTGRLLQQLKRAYADRAVKNGFDDNSLYNDELLKLNEIDLTKFSNLKKIVGASKAAPKSKDIDINKQGLTDEEYEKLKKIEKKPPKQRTPEDEERLAKIKEQQKQKNTAISILRGISIRMPLLIYGADIDIQEDFTLDMFLDDKIVDPDSWNEFMPTGVTKELFKEFMRYYDPEIFVSAGRKIRNTVKSADELLPTERVQKISQLFTCFKNPDKETVLTPWRVVNMHMGDCLGGYVFYGEDFDENNKLEKPRFVDQGQVTADTLGNSKAQILEINSKTGLYPLYVTYSIFRSKCQQCKENELTVDLQEKLWNETVEKNIFVICKTPMAKSITKRTLVGFKNVKVNSHAFDDLIGMLKDKPQQFVDRVTRANFWDKKGSEKMKFDAVVGNPPYQETTENTSDKPVYHLFMNAAFKLSDKVSFITPARFLFNAGKTPKDWNNQILSDKHFKVIWYKAKSTEIFDNVDIKGGVAVTFRDANQDFGGIGIYSAYVELNSILKKVKSNNFSSLSDFVYAPESYKFSQKIHLDNPWVSKRLSKGHLYDITTNIFDKLPELFFKEKISNDYVGIYGREKNERICKYIKRCYIVEHQNLDFYKVFVPKSNGSGSLGEVLSTPVIGYPEIGHTQTFISIGAFNDKNEAEALLKYIKGKFSRCMLGVLKVTQDNKKSVWANVPLQDFTDKSDIDWSKSIPNIDLQLYAKYNLTEEEITFIESKIKPME